MFSTYIPDCLIPANEAQRLATLQSYGILDTPAEETYDKIARLARQIFNASYSFINFVNTDTVFSKSNHSPLEGNLVPREFSLCSIAVHNAEVTVFTDTHEQEQLLSNPFIKMDDGIRFYAGAPLKAKNGYPLGTLCVLDTEPKLVTARQVEMLETLATIVMDELDFRKLSLHQKEYTAVLQEKLEVPAAIIGKAAQEVIRSLPDNSPLKVQVSLISLAAKELNKIMEGHNLDWKSENT